MINELYEKIINNGLKYKNTVIIGDNSTGKTTLLKLLSKEDGAVFISCPYDKDMLDYFNDNCSCVLIDNIETALSYKDIVNINEFLNSRFKFRKIVVVTHNLDIVSRLKDFNIINMYKDYYGVYDGNDFNSYDDVRNIVSNSSSMVDIMRATLLYFKLNDLWTSVEEERVRRLGIRI